MKFRKFVPTIERIGFVGILIGIVTLGVFRGLQIYSVNLDIFGIAVEILMMDAVFSSVSFSVFLLLSGCIYWFRGIKADNSSIQSGPEVGIVVPAYKEGETLRKCVESIRESNYENLRVIPACEKGDEETVRVAKNLEEAHEDVDAFINSEEDSSKPKTVNAAFEHISEEFIGVFDADSHPHPDFIGAGMKSLSIDNYEVAQARLIPEPSGLMETFSYYGNILFSKLPQQLVLLLPGFNMALSNGTLMKKSTWRKVGKYGDLMTDDYDFSLKCYRNRMSVKMIRDYPVMREPAHTWKDWWLQRKRWMLSYMQVAHKLLLDIKSFRSYRDFIALFIAVSSIAGSFFAMMFVSKMLLLLYVNIGYFYILPPAIIMIIAFFTNIQDKRIMPMTTSNRALLVSPLILPLMALISIKASLSYFLTWEGGFYHTSRD